MSAVPKTPLFRYDLHTEAVTIGSDRFVDVESTEGNRFRLFEVEYAVACGMDGQRTLDEIVHWAKSELELRTDVEEVSAIAHALSEQGYLEEAYLAAQGTPAEAVADDAVELGAPGRSTIPRTANEAPVLTPAEFELGEAGPRESDEPRPASDAPVIELGAAGYDEPSSIDAIASTDFSEPSKSVSTDLSQSFRIDPNEVREAVRASKVMQAVAPPMEEDGDELDIIDEPIPMGPGSDDAPMLSAEKTPPPPPSRAEAKPVASKAVLTPAEALAESVADLDVSDGDKAIEVPETPSKKIKSVETEKKKPAKAIDFNSAPIVVWLLLLLAVVGAAAYYYWNYVRETPDDSGQLNPVSAEIVRKSQSAALSNGPAPIIATLSVKEGSSAPILASKSGSLSWTVEEASVVEENQLIAKLDGAQRFDRQIQRNKDSLADYQERLAATVASGGSASRIANLEANVARKTSDVEAAEAKQAAYLLLAPASGTVKWTAPDKGVREGDQIGTVSTAEEISASFEQSGAIPVIGAEVIGQLGDDATKQIRCTVAAVEASTVTLGCESTDWENGTTFRVLPDPAGGTPADKAAPTEGSAPPEEGTEAEAAEPAEKTAPAEGTNPTEKTAPTEAKPSAAEPE